MRSEKPNLKPERPDLRSKTPDFETDARANEQKSPCVLKDFVLFATDAQKGISIITNKRNKKKWQKFHIRCRWISVTLWSFIAEYNCINQ